MKLSKKTVYDKLVTKVNNIGTTGNIPDTSGIVKKRDFNAKITEIERKIASISGLAATTTTLTAVENKMSDVSNLV